MFTPMFDDGDRITISYCHEGESRFEMDLYLPTLVTCSKSKMSKILNQFIKDEKCEEKAKKLLNFWEQQRDKYECDRRSATQEYVNISTEVSELQTVVNTKKHPVGTRLTKVELQDAKKAACRQESTQKTHLRYLEIQL